jgi:hypothetical protein
MSLLFLYIMERIAHMNSIVMMVMAMNMKMDPISWKHTNGIRGNRN